MKATSLPRGLAPLWFLNDAATPAEQIGYMRRCKAAGIDSLTLHSRLGNRIPFASDQWFSMITELVEEAVKLGMTIWLYDEDPYPSGAAGGLVMGSRPDLRAYTMSLATAPRSLKKGRLWFIGVNRVIWAGLMPLSDNLPAIDLTAAVGPLRTDMFVKEWDSRYYYCETPVMKCVRAGAVRVRQAITVPEIPPGYQLAAVQISPAGEWGPWGSSPDLLQRETFDVFAHFGLDPYVEAVGEHFGGVIPGIFTDEAKPGGGAMPYTKDLFDDFEKQSGYDLRTRLYHLFGEPSPKATITRLDYRRWIGHRFLEAFVKPYRKWCESHSLHLVGHFSPEDDPISETFCLSAVMPIMKNMGLPGCDIITPLVGDSKSPTLNLGSLRVGSIKSQNGKRYGISESQALGDWTISTSKTRQIYAWQKILGIDRFFTHAFFNSIDGPIGQEAPPDFGPKSPLFRGTSAVNHWLKQLDAITDGSCEVADVAILDNMLPYWNLAHEMKQVTLQRWRRAWWKTILNALRAHIGIHCLDSQDASQGKVTVKGFKVGQRTYKAIIIPKGDLLDLELFHKLQEAAASGNVRIHWLGGGPDKLVGWDNKLTVVPELKGKTENFSAPSVTWFRTNFEPQARLTGKNASDIYVRRFKAEDKREYLLACNLAEEPQTVVLPAEETVWNPVDELVDGSVENHPKGVSWQVPAMGAGLFVSGKPRHLDSVTHSRPLAGKPVFKRLAPNRLRLDACRISLAGHPPRHNPYPQPYWKFFDSYKLIKGHQTFGGLLPIESETTISDLRYQFEFKSLVTTPKVYLILEPRAIRGQCRVLHNGAAISKWLEFPLATTTPRRIPLTIQRGVNKIEIHFEAESAMEGILTNLYLEGDFSVVIGADGEAVVGGDAPRHSSQGWLEMGLAHYGGDGLYSWTENFTPDDLKSEGWFLELSHISDSAELRVNGESMGTLAWAPWRWPLKSLKSGANRFELTLSPGAGNSLALRYPRQPQGWIGGGCLLRHGQEKSRND